MSDQIDMRWNEFHQGPPRSLQRSLTNLHSILRQPDVRLWFALTLPCHFFSSFSSLSSFWYILIYSDKRQGIRVQSVDVRRRVQLRLWSIRVLIWVFDSKGDYESLDDFDSIGFVAEVYDCRGGSNLLRRRKQMETDGTSMRTRHHGVNASGCQNVLWRRLSFGKWQVERVTLTWLTGRERLRERLNG